MEFTVIGAPVPQGSMKGFVIGGRAHLTSDNSKLKPWRQEVAGTALLERERQQVAVISRPSGVSISVSFYFSRPKSVKVAALKTTKPDIDKLLRATLDALTGILFEDDSQVIHSEQWKHFAATGEPPHATIKVLKV